MTKTAPGHLHECRARPQIGNHSFNGIEFADHFAFVDAGFGECVRVDLIDALVLGFKSGFEYVHILKSYKGLESYGVATTGGAK